MFTIDSLTFVLRLGMFTGVDSGVGMATFGLAGIIFSVFSIFSFIGGTISIIGIAKDGVIFSRIRLGVFVA